MIRKIFIGVIFCLVFGHSVFAQEITPIPALNERWVCLDGIRCADCAESTETGEIECTPKEGANCSEGLIGLEGEHTARLRQKEGANYQVLPNKDTYIVTCFPSELGGICTTGDSYTDQKVYGQNNVVRLQEETGFNFYGLYNSDGSKRSFNYILATEVFDEYEWSDYTPESYERKFYALNYVDPEVNNSGTTGDAAAQQQGTLKFSFTNQSNSSDCLSVHWDPYGRVFDSQTLEPIKGAKVTLLMKRKDGNFTPMTPNDLIGGATQNPYITKEDGIYNFVVPTGDYKIVVEHPDYNFPNNVSKLNSNYKKIYWQIYPNQTGEIIQERPPKLEFRDIPLDPKIVSAINEPKLMEYFYSKQKIDKKSIVEGRVSLPFSTVNAYSVKNQIKYRLLNSIKADKMGRFKILVDENKFEKNETFGKLEYNAKFLNLDPISNYIEGYAYDQTGKVLPNATVGIYLNFSNKPYFETKTDEQGYYKISSQHLPIFPYTIRYTASTGTTIKLTTAKFIDQNKQFISGQKIDLNDYKDNKGEVITRKIANNSLMETNSKSTGIVSLTPNNQNNLILAAVIILVLISAVAAIVGVYVYKKNNS